MSKKAAVKTTTKIENEVLNPDFAATEKPEEYKVRNAHGKGYTWYSEKAINGRSHCRICKGAIDRNHRRLVLETINPFHPDQTTKKYFCQKCALSMMEDEIANFNRIRMEMLTGDKED